MLNRISDYLPATWNMARKAPGSEGPPSPEGKPADQSWTQAAEQFVKTHPGASLAVAFCVGVTLAWWIKRR